MTKHRPTTTAARQWWRHLRRYWRRDYWKRARRDDKAEDRAEVTCRTNQGGDSDSSG